MNAVDDLLDRVREAVRMSRHTQARIAEAAGISQKHLSMFMRGHSVPSVMVLRDLCDLLDVR